MSDWLRIEFFAQLPDGMEAAVNNDEVSEVLTRTFGFSRVDHVSVSQVSDSDGRLRNLINDRPSEGTPIWPSR